MTDQKHTKEAYHFADMILQASGSSLCYYSMDKTRTEILDAAQSFVTQLEDLRKQRDELREALKGCEAELLDVLHSTNKGHVHFCGDDFHERLTNSQSVLTKTKGSV